MPCAPPPPMDTAQARFVEGASPPKTLPIDPVNMACAAAVPSRARHTAIAASKNRVVRKMDLRKAPERGV